MKRNENGLSRGYATALHKHLKQGARASLRPARGLGCRAVVEGLETLDLARIHEAALASLKISGRQNGITKRAEMFFAEAITPIEETHRAARQSNLRLGRLQEMLGARTEELATTNRQLKRGIARRKVMEEAFEKRGKHHKKSLKESLQLQKRLRQMTHRVLLVQEDERKRISRELHDEIAQTLLAINVRLLALKLETRRNTKGFKDELARTQRLVVNSAKSVRRVAREFKKA